MPNSENIFDVREISADVITVELEKRLNNISRLKAIWLIDRKEPKKFYTELKNRNLFFQNFAIDENEHRLLICKY